ncbi:DUF1660 family phage protein [Bacteroides neonati]
MNLICRIFGHSYNWHQGIVYCARCFSVSEEYKRYIQIPPPNKSK